MNIFSLVNLYIQLEFCLGRESTWVLFSGQSISVAGSGNTPGRLLGCDWLPGAGALASVAIFDGRRNGQPLVCCKQA